MRSSADQIDHLLQYIGADDYQNWIKVGMGLKSEFGDSGLQLWDKWSQSSEKYNAAEIPKKWESFRDGGIGLGTVIYLAKEQGFRGQCWRASGECWKIHNDLSVGVASSLGLAAGNGFCLRGALHLG